MAAAPPSMSVQPTSMQTDSTSPISWEGDKMFNIYIYDYCTKRGFRKTAKELMQEAEISAEATPPINARQGLLFEWWSVFWVLFQAKSNGGGSDDGLVYIHHQAAQRQQASSRGQITSSTGQPSQPPQQQQPPIGRLPNGIPPSSMQPAMTRPPSTYLANGGMPNGVAINPGAQPQSQPGQQMPPNTSMNFGAMGTHPPPQPNGINGPGPGPGGPSQQQPPSQGIPNQAMPFGMPPNQQRPPTMMNGIPQQPRGPSSGPFHSSPTMAHSPQHNAGTPGHPGQQQQPGQPQQSQSGGPGQQAPMAQLGPSPHIAPMNRAGGMMPPNSGPPGMNSINSGPPQPQQQGPPTPGFQHQQLQNQGGQPPSRTNTPRSGMMAHSSPSMAARQTPGAPPGMGPSGPGQNILSMQSGIAPTSNPDQMNHEIMQIPANSLNALKSEIGCGDKDISILSMHEKQLIISSWRQQNTSRQQRKDGQGPPGMMQAPGQPGQPPSQQQQQQRPGAGPPPQQQRIKRNSTSPSEEHETLPRNESSPPARKKLRPSPGESSGVAPSVPYPHPGSLPPGPQRPGLPGQQPPPPGQQPMSQQQQQQQQMSQHMMMRGGIPMNGGVPMGGPGGAPPPPLQQQHQHQLQPQPMLTGPPSGMGGSMMQMGPPGSGSMMSPQQQQAHANQQQQAQQQQQQQQAHQAQLYRMQPKPPGAPDHTFNQGPAPAPGPQFNSGLNRLQNKPNMLPPPSPAMNGLPKDIKQEPGSSNKPPPNGQQQQQQLSHNADGSPRNPPPGGPSGSGTAPPTPVPSNQPNPQQQQQPPSPHMNNIISSSVPGMPSLSSSMGSAADINIFDPAFMDGFDASGLFRPDGDINFERDFGQWFNPDDAMMNSSMDMK